MKGKMILTDTEQLFDKIQLPFMIRAHNKVGTEKTYFNIIKAIHDTLTAHILSFFL